MMKEEQLDYQWDCISDVMKLEDMTERQFINNTVPLIMEIIQKMPLKFLDRLSYNSLGMLKCYEDIIIKTMELENR